jgi:alkylation response protein AidB-like acyl-CoA dehydrogenase
MSTPQSPIDEFLVEARAFLDAHAKPIDHDQPSRWGEGSDRLATYAPRSETEEAERVRAAKDFKAREFDAGLGWITGPTAYGGRELTADHERAYRELRATYDVPSLSLFGISLGMVAPTFHAHGTDIVRERYVRRLYRGELVGCQLFSEPVAGSDLAGLITRADRFDDEWRINGQKVWTSEAHNSDVGLLLARSNPGAQKHAGMTAFAVDLRAPGVEVRPLKMITGGTEFNEVFFDDVRIPDDHRLGEVDKGWSVALYTLMNERALGSGPGVFGVERAVERLLLMAKQPGYRGDDPLVRQELARVWGDAEVLRYMGLRADARRNAGLPPGPEESAFKLANTNVMQRVAKLAAMMTGPALVAETGAWGTTAWADVILTVSGMRIAAGTDEIMKNILGERVLGLPKEPAAHGK